jgi:hypothetical protein
LNKEKCKAAEAVPILKDILKILNTNDAEMVTSYINTKDNKTSDKLSRVKLGDSIKTREYIINAI